MIKKNNMWLVDNAGVQMITKPKRNSTSKVRSHKIGRSKEKQLTKNNYIDLCHKLIKAVGKLTVTNQDQEKIISTLSYTSKSQQQTIAHLRNMLNHDTKALALDHKHEHDQLKLTEDLKRNDSKSSLFSWIKNLL